jgi:Poly(R)-hydroxyalkanoic acid synthase subunit (PHA_synth_III_E)
VSNGTNPDFGDIWRDLLRRWEDAGNSLGADAMKTPEFSQAMNQATNLSMAAQNLFAQTFAKYLNAMNLPTRADVSALAERLQAIEGRIEDIRLMLNDRLGDHAPSDRRTKPTRNRRPPSAGDAAPPEQS